MLDAIKFMLKQAAHARSSGEPAEAERLYKEAAAQAKAKDDVSRAEALMGVAQTRRDKGDLIFAAINYAEAITILRSAGATAELAYALRHAADVRSELKEYAVASSHIEEAIRLYRAVIPNGEARPLDLANALRVSALNNERESYASWAEARDLYVQLNLPDATDECKRHLARLEYPIASRSETTATNAGEGTRP